MSRILVIDDTQEELEKARAAIEAAGHEAVTENDIEGLIEILPTVDGVLTDLHFHPCEFMNIGKDLPPTGLLVVIAALKANKPVVICTSGDHHGKDLAWIHDYFLQGAYRHGQTKAPFDLADYKNWELAIRNLEYRLAQPD